MPVNTMSRAAAHARQDRALAMREAGVAYSVIARDLGYAEGGGGVMAAVRAAEARRNQRMSSVNYVFSPATLRVTATQTTTATPAPTRPIRGRTFGVEAEFYGIDSSVAVAALTAVGIRVHDSTNSYNHQTLPTWKIVGDGSVSGTSGGRHWPGRELVSPILQGAAGLAQVKLALDTLRAAGAKVNRTCGLHVHVGMDGVSGSAMMKILDLYRTNESNINQLVAPTRRGSNGYCRLLSSGNGYRSNYDGLRTVSTPSRDRVDPRIVQFARGVDRYYTVNVAAYARHGTLEFRQHQGTVVGNKAVTWVEFVLALVDKAVTLDTAEAPAANLSEFADFLGLTGTSKRRLVARAEVLSNRRNRGAR